jgi:hypothetical protein
MFTIITNYKKMFSSFIKNELSGPAVSPAVSSTPVTVKDFRDGDDLEDLKNLKKIFNDKKINLKELQVINNSINQIT